MPHPNQTVAIFHGNFGEVLDPGRNYPDDHPLVKAYPQFFTPLANDGAVIDSVGIEDASAEPGRKRRVTVKKK